MGGGLAVEARTSVGPSYLPTGDDRQEQICNVPLLGEEYPQIQQMRGISSLAGVDFGPNNTNAVLLV